MIVLFDEDEPSEEEREDLFLDTGERKSNKTRESRKEREEKLKRMMEDDDGNHYIILSIDQLLTTV
jgi:hypothetical protein